MSFLAITAVVEVWGPLVRDLELGELRSVELPDRWGFVIVPGSRRHRHHFVLVSDEDVARADSLAVYLDGRMDGLVGRAWLDQPYGGLERHPICLIHITDWVCPADWSGMSRVLDDGRVVFACGACPCPDDCANNHGCERDEREEEDQR